MAAPKGTKPVAPKNCPLFAHASGTWAKTINGKHKHFGPWHDLEGALKKWEAFDLARRAGVEPRPIADGWVRLKDVANRFLTFHHQRAKGGDLNLRSFRDMSQIINQFAEAVGSHLPLAVLSPETFTAYRAKLAQRLGMHALKRHVVVIKQLFKWAYENDLVDRPMKFGTGFSGEKKERVESRRKRLNLSFTADEIRKMVKTATVPLRAMILLAINCGFGNTDVGTLEWADLVLEKGLLDTFRHKTGVRRRCVLWPETVKALKSTRALKRKGVHAGDAGIVFINQAGNRYVRETPIEKQGTIVRVLVVDNIPQEFARLMARIGIYSVSEKTGRPISDGRGFYCLRRTHRTWSSETKDQQAADLIMGHADHSMAAVYVQEIGEDRLKGIADHLHSKLFTSQTQSRRSHSRSGGAAPRGAKPPAGARERH